MTARGPEYADELTAAERRTLDVLVAEVGRRNASPRPSRRAPIAVGLAALAILLAATMVTQLGSSPPPPGSPAASGTGTATPRSAAALFRDLAAATTAVRSPATTGPVEIAYRRRLDVVVSPADGRPGRCRVTAVMIEIWEPLDGVVAVDRSGRHYARLAVERTEPPPAALAGCATATSTRGHVPAPFQGELLLGWEDLSNALAPQAPRHIPLVIVEEDPTGEQTSHLIDDLAKVDPKVDSPDPWWPALVQLLASPQPARGIIAAALEAAAGWAAEAPDGTVELLGPGSDVTGRPGISVRIPYALDGRPTTAELTFDPDTGSLLQLGVSTGTGIEITAFLAIRMQRNW